MVSCCVPFCPSSKKTCKQNVHCFGLPTNNPELLKKWLRAIPRANMNVKSKNMRVCEIHFDPEDIIKHETFTVNGDVVSLPRIRWKLQPDAVPMLFPGCPKYLSKKIPKRRKPKQRDPPERPNKKDSGTVTTPAVVKPRVCHPFDPSLVTLPTAAWNWHETSTAESQRQISFIEVAEDGYTVKKVVAVEMEKPEIVYYIYSKRCYSTLPQPFYYTKAELECSIATFNNLQLCVGLSEPELPSLARWCGAEPTCHGWRSNKCLLVAASEKCDNCIWVQEYSKDMRKPSDNYAL